MRTIFRLAVLLATLALLQGLGPAQDGAPAVDEGPIRAKLLAAQYIEGKIVDLKPDGDNHLLTVQYLHTIKKKADPIAAKKAEFLKIAYDKAVESKFQPAIDKLGAALSQAQREASGIEEVPIGFSLRIDKDTKLRTMVTPVDDNGKPKKFTAEEMKKLKGDPRLPGLTASLEEFQSDRKIQFYIDRIKYKPTPAKPKDKSAEPVKTIYPISMAVILAGPTFNEKDNPFITPGKK
jgi:hypothetical protein